MEAATFPIIYIFRIPTGVLEFFSSGITAFLSLSVADCIFIRGVPSRDAACIVVLLQEARVCRFVLLRCFVLPQR